MHTRVIQNLRKVDEVKGQIMIIYKILLICLFACCLRHSISTQPWNSVVQAGLKLTVCLCLQITGINDTQHLPSNYTVFSQSIDVRIERSDSISIPYWILHTYNTRGRVLSKERWLTPTTSALQRRLEQEDYLELTARPGYVVISKQSGSQSKTCLKTKTGKRKFTWAWWFMPIKLALGVGEEAE